MPPSDFREILNSLWGGEMVCSLWQRPGKALLILANATQADQDVTVRLNLPALGMEGNLAAKDMRTDKTVAMEGEVLRTSVTKSSWGMILVEAR